MSSLPAHTCPAPSHPLPADRGPGRKPNKLKGKTMRPLHFFSLRTSTGGHRHQTGRFTPRHPPLPGVSRMGTTGRFCHRVLLGSVCIALNCRVGVGFSCSCWRMVLTDWKSPNCSWYQAHSLQLQSCAQAPQAPVLCLPSALAPGVTPYLPTPAPQTSVYPTLPSRAQSQPPFQVSPFTRS